MLLDVIFGPLPEPPPFSRPLLTTQVPAGFPSPADDHVDARLDLNDYLIEHRAATFFMFAAGDSMVDEGIFSGDMLIVDKAIRPTDGKVVVADLDGERTVKRFRCTGPHGRVWLESANREKNYPPIVPQPGQTLRVFGVVRRVVRTL